MQLQEIRSALVDVLISEPAQDVFIVAGCLMLAWIARQYVPDYIEWWTGETETNLDDTLYETAEKPLALSLYVLGLYLAVIQISLPADLRFVLVGAIMTLLIGGWSHVAWEYISEITETGRENDDLHWFDEQTAPLLENLAKVIVLAMAAYFLFLAWEINLTAWLASAGIAGVAIGFGAKDLLSNLFGGVFVLIDTPYREGDVIVLDSGERGEVKEIGLRSTRILTPERMEITIPNSTIATAQIVNESTGPAEHTRQRRITTRVGVEYGADLEEVTELLESEVADVDSINSEVDPSIHLVGFGEESLLVRVACQLKNPQHEERCLDQLNRATYAALEDQDLVGPAV